MKIKTNLIEAHLLKKSKKGNEFLIMKRAPNQKYPNIWQMVTGKVRDEEKAYQAAIREIKEETNLNVDEIYTVPKVNSFYDHLDDSLTIIPVFVAVIKQVQDVKLSDEHSESKWVFVEEAKKLFAWPGQREAVDIIDEYFSSQNERLKFIRVKI